MIRPWRGLFALFFIALLLGGCSYTQTGRPQAELPGRADYTNKTWVKRELYTQFDDWRAVKYKIGGLSRQGVDCSGFVYLTFSSRLGIQLPRSTDQQVTVGRTVAKKELISGDLVFFKTGFSSRHVGIYLEDGKFLHASTDKGVMVSHLDDVYWSKRYWKSIRVNA